MVANDVVVLAGQTMIAPFIAVGNGFLGVGVAKPGERKRYGDRAGFGEPGRVVFWGWSTRKFGRAPNSVRSETRIASLVACMVAQCFRLERDWNEDGLYRGKGGRTQLASGVWKDRGEMGHFWRFMGVVDEVRKVPMVSRTGRLLTRGLEGAQTKNGRIPMNRKTVRENERPTEALSRGASYPEPSSIYAIEFLEKQHVVLRDMFAQMKEERSETGRRRLLERVATYLRNHSAIEERHFYPGVWNDETKDMLEHSKEEHQEAEEGLEKLLAEDFDEGFERKFEKLAEDVQHHMRDEEGELFPEVAKTIPMTTLSQLGEEMERSYRLMVLSGPSVADKVSTTKRNATE